MTYTERSCQPILGYMQHALTYTFSTLADELGFSVQHLKQLYSDTKARGQMPPKITLPGGRKVLFRREAVEAWLKSREGKPQTCVPPVPKRRRGRPRKVDQIHHQDEAGPETGMQP